MGELEAEALCDAEIENPINSLCSLASFTLLWICHICHGSGKDGVKAVSAGFEMAKRMKLYGIADTLTSADLLPMRRRIRLVCRMSAAGSRSQIWSLAGAKIMRIWADGGA